MVSKNFRIALPQRKTTLWLLLALAAGLLTWHFTRYRPGGRVQEGDYLIYKMDGALFLYTPYTNEHRPILEELSIDNFTLKNEWLAFSSNNNIYLLNYPFTDTPQPITSEGFDTAYVTNWSNNNHYLAYFTTVQERTTLWVWDNQTQQNIPIHSINSGRWVGADLTWSSNNQLAFIETCYLCENKQADKIFIWNGREVMNLSQNLSEDTYSPTWGPNGQIAFISSSIGQEGTVYTIFIWDGVSKKSGWPDKSTFTTVPSVPITSISYSTDIAWTNDGLFTFSNGQIYQWDGQKITNLSHLKGYEFDHVWYEDGYLALETYDGTEYFIQVRNPSNHTIFTTPGHHTPVWSKYGVLSYCTYNPPQRVLKFSDWDILLSELASGTTLERAYIRASHKTYPLAWNLMLWTGDNTVVNVVTANEIFAQWSNGQISYCRTTWIDARDE